MAKEDEDIAMTRLRALFEKSDWTLHQLGLRAGYPEATARMSAWQFFKTGDPHISMLRRFARALDMTIEDVIAEKVVKKRVHLGDKDMNATIDFVRNSLHVLFSRIKSIESQWPDVIRKKNVKKAKEHIDDLHDLCSRFSKACPLPTPETRQLTPFFKEIAKCHGLPTESHEERQAFLEKADECRAHLRSQVNELWATRNSD